jgi:hypothetical protein
MQPISIFFMGYNPGFSQILGRAYFAHLAADFQLKNQPIAKPCGADVCEIVPPVRRIVTLLRRGAKPEYPGEELI